VQFLNKSLLTFLRRLDYQLSVVLTYVEAEEVEALRDVCDECLKPPLQKPPPENPGVCHRIPLRIKW
jgi:hypothetical protein